MLMEAWKLWWVWLVFAAMLGVAEMLLPGFILLGFAIGALAMAALVATGLFGTSFAATVLVFALASVVAWWWLNRVFPRDRGNVRIWDRDINDN
jgi:membrane protein implicated in regulation of membrane protease activity